MKFKVKEMFIKAAKLNEGVYFAKVVGNVKLEIVSSKSKDGLIPILVRREKNHYIVDIPDGIVEKLKHREGSEIDMVPDGSVYIL